MKKTLEERIAKRREPEMAPAFYEEKELWKSKPGNRYTPRELEAMERNWTIRITRPACSRSQRAD